MRSPSATPDAECDIVKPSSRNGVVVPGHTDVPADGFDPSPTAIACAAAGRAATATIAATSAATMRACFRLRWADIRTAPLSFWMAPASTRTARLSSERLNVGTLCLSVRFASSRW